MRLSIQWQDKDFICYLTHMYSRSPTTFPYIYFYGILDSWGADIWGNFCYWITKARLGYLPLSSKSVNCAGEGNYWSSIQNLGIWKSKNQWCGVPKFGTILLLYMKGVEKVFMVQSRSLLSTKRRVLLCPV